MRYIFREWLCKWFHIHDYNTCSMDDRYSKLYNIYEDECNWCDHVKVTITPKTYDEDLRPINPSISVADRI